MGWVASGVSVTLDWHVYAGGAWRVETREIGSAAPVNVYVTPSRTAPVMYRHQAVECAGRCVLACGHPLSYGCDCDTIAAEACQGDSDGVCDCVPGVSLGCEAEPCVIAGEPRYVSPYGLDTLGFSLD